MRFINGHNVSNRNPPQFMWKGDAASAKTKHAWLARHFPKTGVCEECGKAGRTDYAFKRHPEPHTRDRSDYRELCRPCHQIFDEPIVQRIGTMHATVG